MANFSLKERPKLQTALIFIGLCFLAYFPIFFALDHLSLQFWDESRLANNALSMYYDGDYIVTHFEGNPDLWNTKPPLMIWLQVMFMKITGISILAVRLPSAIAAMITVMFLYFYTKRLTGTRWVIAPILVLITSYGYIRLHGTRTGDYDALLTLFTTLSYLYFYRFHMTKKYSYLYCFSFFLALGVLTKSVPALFFAPGVFIFLIYKKELATLLSSKHFYFALVLFLALVVPYYLLREQQNPGYLEAVRLNDLGGRFLKAQENHSSTADFYLLNMKDLRFIPWLFVLPISLYWGIRQGPSRYRDLYVYLTLLLITFLLVITISTTKLDWYDIPMYPLMALALGVFIDSMFASLRQHRFGSFSTPLLLVIVYYLTFYFPYTTLTHRSLFPEEPNPHEQQAAIILQQGLEGKRDLEGHRFCIEDYNAQNLFYIRAMQNEGKDIRYAYPSDFRPDMIVWAYQDQPKKMIDKLYTFEVLEEHQNLVCYKLISPKDAN